MIRRIEEEATRSGESLNEDQRSLLHFLPMHSAFDFAPNAEHPPVLLPPRDTTYERLCALAKAAYHNDLRINPPSALDWNFAAAVSKLNRHPMSWLLQSGAGLKVRQAMSQESMAFLLVAGIGIVSPIAAVPLLMGKESATTIQWASVGTGYVAFLLLLYFASRRIEVWQLNRTIEGRRRDIAQISSPKT